MVLECLKSHFKAFTKPLLDLFWERLGEAKEFSIDQLRSLIDLPRFLIPFGDEVGSASVAKLEAESTELDQTLVKEVEEEQELSGPLLHSLQGTSRNVQRSEDFVVWLVESILDEFRTLFASDLDGVVDGRSKVESTGGASSMLSSTPFAGLCTWMGKRVLSVHEVESQGESYPAKGDM